MFSLVQTIYNFLDKLSKIFFLNLIFILFCLPIVTIGASTAALFKVSMLLTEDYESNLFRNFWNAFKENWKQGTILFLLHAFVYASCILYLNFFENIDSNPIVFLFLAIILALLGINYLIYSYPLIVKYKNTIKRTLINSSALVREYYLATILMLLALLILNLGFIWNTVTIFLFFLIGPALNAYIISSFAVKRFEALEE